MLLGGGPRKVGGRGTEREIGPKPLSWFAQGETDEAESHLGVRDYWAFSSLSAQFMHAHLQARVQPPSGSPPGRQ